MSGNKNKIPKYEVEKFGGPIFSNSEHSFCRDGKNITISGRKITILELSGEEIDKILDRAEEHKYEFSFGKIKNMLMDAVPSCLVGITEEEFRKAGMSFYMKLWPVFKEVNKPFLWMLDLMGITENGKLKTIKEEKNAIQNQKEETATLSQGEKSENLEEAKSKSP